MEHSKLRICRHAFLAAFLALSGEQAGAGDIEATTADGRTAILHDDGTWAWHTDGEASTTEAAAVESVDEAGVDTDHTGDLRVDIEQVQDQGGACRIGMRLHNQADYEIREFVFKVSAYKAGSRLFDTDYVQFNSIRPTLDQYKTAEIRLISCAEIVYLRIHGGERCRMDDLTRYSPDKDACLRRVTLGATTGINAGIAEP